MVVYLVTSIFELSPGNFKKYSVAYDSIESALEYVELDMSAQYEGAYAEVMTDDVKDLIRMRGDFFFKYGTAAHYIMIENMDVHTALPDNVDNVIRFSLTEHEIEPVEEGEEGEEGEDDVVEDEEELDEDDTTNEENEEFEEGENLDETQNDVINTNETPIVESAESTIGNVDSEESGAVNESSIDGLDEEELPAPETVPLNDTVEPPVNGMNDMDSSADSSAETSANTESANISSENMGSTNISSGNMTSETNTSDSNINSETSNTSETNEAPSNIPAALQSTVQIAGKRRTRRKVAKGQRKSRKL
jgi:hypothetical protein